MKLKEYRDKRDFARTAEPRGTAAQAGKNRFVVQFHKARREHYDFRLEHGGVLLSWAVPKGIPKQEGEKRLAVHVEDHPVEYVAFEGMIPQGNYGAGSVEIYDSGTYVSEQDVERGMKKGHLRVYLHGNRYEGGYDLVRMEKNDWLIIKASGTEQVSSLPFQDCDLMLATLVHRLPTGKNWVAEIKYDGYRILSFCEGGRARLLSRNKHDYTDVFPSVTKALQTIARDNFVLDGEIVCFDERGKSDFGLLRKNMKKKNANVCYVAFDLLALDGEDLRSLPLLKRKEALERLLYRQSESLVYSSHVTELSACLAFSREQGLEGVVLKRADSAYTGGRGESWLKLKNRMRQEFVVAGYTLSEKDGTIAALLLGYYDGEALSYVGKVGTGLSGRDKETLLRTLRKRARKTNPFSYGGREKGAFYVTPNTVVEVEYQERTQEGLLRQASFIGVREDKAAKEVSLEDARKRGGAER